MSYSPKPRVAIDLDEIARQLNEPRPASAAASGRSDPLAELAKIAGQDDPYTKLLGPGPAGQARGAEIQFPPVAPADHPYGDDEAAYEPHYTEDAYNDTYPSEEQEDLVALRPRRSRKGLMAVAGVLGVAAVAVGGALFFGAGEGFVPAGEPPVIAAAEGPVKVQPQSPGGVEIPNQNKQIYERAATETQTRVVNREEQPVDVRQAVRTAATGQEPVAAPAQQPVQQNALAASLGEPRRVRTVAIRPDGSVISDAAPVGAGPAAPPAPAVPAPAAPAPSAQTPASSPSAVPSTPVPVVTANPAPAPRPAMPWDAPAQGSTATAPSTPGPVAQPRPASPPPAAPAAVATPAPRPAAATPALPAAATPQPSTTPAPTRLAAVPANGPVSMAPGPSASSNAGPAASTGGWAVQLGVRSSEGEARSAFAQFQAKYPELKEESPIIRQAEVNGSTIYRVRVGPLSKDDAAALCSKLQGSGGQCFVAKN